MPLSPRKTHFTFRSMSVSLSVTTETPSAMFLVNVVIICTTWSPKGIGYFVSDSCGFPCLYFRLCSTLENVTLSQLSSINLEQPFSDVRLSVFPQKDVLFPVKKKKITALLSRRMPDISQATFMVLGLYFLPALLDTQKYHFSSSTIDITKSFESMFSIYRDV